MRKLPAKLASQLYGAAELIAERGLDGTKIEDIAEATGIPKATIYYHLDGKNAVLEFLLSDLLDMIAGAVGVAVSSAEDARTRLEAAVVAQLGVMLEHPFLCRALVGDLGRATRLPELAVALRAAFYEPIEQLLTDGVADGSLRQVPNPGAVALSVFGAITVAGLTAAVEGPSDDPSADAVRLSASITELIFDGLAHHPVAVTANPVTGPTSLNELRASSPGRRT
jgi:AcrR family transcriptional regulator